MSHTLESLRAVDGRYQHIYLSPHLDDAVLSCGGAIARQAQEGARVLIITACAGQPAADAAPSPFARRLHEGWGLSGPEAARARRREDEAAAACVGADVLWLDFLDAIYRDPVAYRDEFALFGPLTPGDPLPAQLGETLAEVAARCPDATIRAPLGVGMHVDHRAVHVAAAAAALGVPVVFYEDFPYITRAGAIEQRLQTLGGAAAWSSSVRSIDVGLERRIEAIRCYASQVGMLFGDEETMALRVSEHARSLRPEGATYGERVWAPAASGSPAGGRH